MGKISKENLLNNVIIKIVSNMLDQDEATMLFKFYLNFIRHIILHYACLPS